MARAGLGLTILFSILLVFGIVELGLMADIVHFFDDRSRMPSWIKSRAIYVLFAASFTVLTATIWLAFSRMVRPVYSWIYALTVTIMTFTIWITAAALLEVAFTDAYYNRCSALFGHAKCHEMRAARSFAWLLMITALVTVPLAGLYGFRIDRHTAGSGNITTRATTNECKAASGGSHNSA